MEYCKVCGCYIPHNVKECLACAAGKKEKSKETSMKSETNRYMPADEPSKKAMDEAQKRREQMQEQFKRHKAAAEYRNKEK